MDVDSVYRRPAGYDRLSQRQQNVPEGRCDRCLDPGQCPEAAVMHTPVARRLVGCTTLDLEYSVREPL
jgi:hypothetical protein